MLLLAFRSFFFIAVILGYSTGIWRLINDYFRREFQSYLEVESQTNKYLLRDPPKAVPDRNPAGLPDVPDNQLPASNVEQLFGNAQPRHDHQQVTDSIMAIFDTTTTTNTGNAHGNVEQETVTHRPGEVTVVAAAEVADIRPQDEGKLETTDGEDEDKWIAYWNMRGRKRANSEADESSADAYCTISAQTNGAVTRIAQQTPAHGNGFDCT